MALFHQSPSGSKVGRNIGNALLGPLNFMSAEEYEKYAKEYARAKAKELAPQYEGLFSEDELTQLLVSQMGDTPGFWSRLYKATPFSSIFSGFEDEDYITNIDSAVEQLLRELENSSSLGVAPEVSLDSAMKSAKEEIDAEIAQQEKALADLLSQQTASYNDAAEQMLSSDYQRNASLMGTYQSEMRRAQRNALEAGASAGARLANNINVTLSTQNQQAQQSLETSNNLAQMLLNQRQAASDIAQKRVGLRSGYTERVNAYGQQKYADQQARLGEWETRARDTISGGLSSPYADAILAKRRNQQNSGTGTTSTFGT